MAWNKEADINIKVQEHSHLSFDQLIGLDVIFRWGKAMYYNKGHKQP